jgi:hypothetical protein
VRGKTTVMEAEAIEPAFESVELAFLDLSEP